MAITILYNGSNPFGTRTPFVSQDYSRQDINGFISGVNRIVISGTRPRPTCNSTFANYKADIDTLKNFFALNFKSLQILENGVEIFKHPAAKVVSISVPEDSFSSFYPFEITLDCIDSYNNQGILDPVNQWASSEAADGTVTLTHTVSARGVGEQAFEKARAFVLTESQPDPYYLFLEDGIEEVLFLDDGITPVLLDEGNRRHALISRRTSCSRLTGEFSMTETWVYNPEYKGSGYGVITYQTTVSQNNGESVVEISGDIQVNRIDVAANEINKAKNTFDTIDFQAVAQQEFERMGGSGTLATVQEFSVTETPDLGTVSFSLGWNSFAESSPYIVDSSTVSTSKIGGQTCFQYSGTVKSDSGCGGVRSAAIKTFFDNVNWEARIIQKWNKYGTGERLAGNAKSKSITYNGITGEITFSMQYCVSPEVECGAIENFKYTLDFIPSIEQYAADPILRKAGFYAVQDLGYKNRQGFSINGSARRIKCFSKETAMGEIAARANLIMLKYFPAYNRILLTNEIETDENGDFFSFNFSWNADASVDQVYQLVFSSLGEPVYSFNGQRARIPN